MISQLTNALRQHQSDGTSQPRKGTITGYDGRYSVKVMIQPDGFETGWIQLDALGVGNGWGVAVGPQIGDEVSVSFDSGDMNLGHVTARHFNDVSVPMAVPSGETWIVHQSGALLKFLNDGSVSLHSTVAISYDAPQHIFTGGPVTMDHTLTVTGGDVIADTISLKTHRTSGVQSGSGTSSVPVQ